MDLNQYLSPLNMMIRDFSDTEYVKFRASYPYSYRHQPCVGIVGDHRHLMQVVNSMIQDLTATACSYAMEIDDTDEDREDAEKLTNEVLRRIDLLMGMNLDSMGLSSIMYWEQIPALDETECEDEDDGPFPPTGSEGGW